MPAKGVFVLLVFVASATAGCGRVIPGYPSVGGASPPVGACELFSSAQFSSAGLLGPEGIAKDADPRPQLQDAERLAKMSRDPTLYKAIVASAPLVLGSYDPRLVSKQEIHSAIAQYPTLVARCHSVGAAFSAVYSKG